MSYFLLFSTTNPSKEVVETFVRESQRDPNANNVWVLLRNRDQPITSRETPLPVDDFVSEWAGASPDDVGAFLLSYAGSDRFERWLSPDTLVLLDDRSARDKKTAVVIYRDERMPEELEEEGEWDEDKLERFWRVWRVPMATAFGVTGALAVKPDLVVKFFEKDGVDEDGVFHYRPVEKDIEAEESGK